VFISSIREAVLEIIRFKVLVDQHRFWRYLTVRKFCGQNAFEAFGRNYATLIEKWLTLGNYMTFNFVESNICDSNLIIFSERSALEGAIFSDSAVSKWKIDFSRSPRPIGLVMQEFVRSHVGTMDHVLDLVLLQSLFCNCPQGMLFRASARFTIWLIPSLNHTGCIFSADIL
jgi:hypothetical protein